MNWRSIGRWTWGVVVHLAGAVFVLVAVVVALEVGNLSGWKAVGQAVWAVALLGLGLLALGFDTEGRKT